MYNYFLKIRSRHPSHSVLRKSPILKSKDRIIYRLGSTTESLIERELNSVEAIKNSSNKLKMKTLFTEANVKTPKFYNLTNIPENSFPLLAKKVYGSKGRGMILINNQEELDNFLSQNLTGYYIEEFFNGSREYRLHVSELGCFYACRKLRKSDAEKRWFFNSLNCIWVTEKEKVEDENGNFLNFSEEDKKSFNKPNTWDTIIEQSQLALKSVGLDIGAIDVRVNKKGEFMILETNSAPSFGNITEIMYKEHLSKLIKHKFYNN